MKRTLGDLVQVMINTRDLCGNVSHAVRDWEDENGKLTFEERCSAFEEFSRLWSEFERQAKSEAMK